MAPDEQQLAEYKADLVRNHGCGFTGTRCENCQKIASEPAIARILKDDPTGQKTHRKSA